MKRLTLFWVLLRSILLLLHLYIGYRLWPAVAGNLVAQVTGGLLLAASYLLVPLALNARRLRRRWLIWLASIAMGMFSWLLVLTLLRDVVLGIALLLPSGLLPDNWHILSAQLVLLLTGVLSLVGLVLARKVPRVVSVEVPLPHLPTSLQELKIVQLSDIHVGPTIKGGYLTTIVEQVNALKPDIVAITGDLIDGTVAELANEVRPLSQLKATYGVFFVTGNHEYYSGAESWIHFLRALNIRVLINEHVVIRHRSAALILAGVTDYTAGQFLPSHRSDPAAAVAGSIPGCPRILLAHQPRTVFQAEPAGFDLQISGHTHGGQIWPWGYFVPMQQPFTAGLQRHGRMWVYTSRGTGYWGPPMRLGAPSEITCLRLTPQQA